MIETAISITINRKSDIEVIQDKIIEQKFQFPIYIREYDSNFQLDFTSDYEEWELDSKILDCFPGYEYITDIENGKKEIRIEISRYQSEYSPNVYGKAIENPLNETKYLVKKSSLKTKKFNPIIKVLFENQEHYYYINITQSFNENTKEQGFVLIDNFKTKNEDNTTKILQDRLYKSPLEAFLFGYSKVSELVNNDFSNFQNNKKAAIKEEQKAPRKIIRDFINSCNKSKIDDVIKNLDANIIFLQYTNQLVKNNIINISEFIKYLNSSHQQLLGKDFKIRSSWDMNLPSVSIGIKYYPKSDNMEIQSKQKYEQITFNFENNKIISIIHDI
ncbi:hypothetical protein [Myroides fluvii]|uniref:hypothetical protein n=1 Tax=Myroides fluvii TaxID=2572594 RepID=UPI00131D9292|nr:hypothetical protein [Myroides fluvii]